LTWPAIQFAEKQRPPSHGGGAGAAYDSHSMQIFFRDMNTPEPILRRLEIR